MWFAWLSGFRGRGMLRLCGVLLSPLVLVGHGRLGIGWIVGCWLGVCWMVVGRWLGIGRVLAGRWLGFGWALVVGWLSVGWVIECAGCLRWGVGSREALCACGGGTLLPRSRWISLITAL